MVTATSWVAKRRDWNHHLLSLPVDWSQPLYARFGNWTGASGCYLREDAEEPSLHPRDSQHERRHEVGLSVVQAEPGDRKWRLIRPSQFNAIYKLPDDYFAQFKGRPMFILQGERIPAGEHYDESSGEVFTIWAAGADGEPLLEVSSLKIITKP